MTQFTVLSGFVAVRLTSADIPGLFRRVTKENIPLCRIRHYDSLTVYVWIQRSHYGKFKSIAEHCGAEVCVVRRTGLYWGFRSLLRRPILILGIGLILLLSWFVPTRVLFISIEGNESIPAKLILEKAADCGISFGADRREVRSEKMKNNLLAALPELQWTGINTHGCTAVISVKERSQTDEKNEQKGVSRIVADRDGVIHSCTVTSGNPLCVKGQVVRAGETLISGYTDCGIKIQATRAAGEIFAQTMRNITVKIPLDYTNKGTIYRLEKKYSLLLGKNRINFYKDSGILPATCDKMYSQYYCVLPGGFQLPAALVVERYYFRETEPLPTTGDLSQTYAQSFAKEYLQAQMLSGKILAKQEKIDIVDSVCTLTGKYICLEMIGREQSEEIIKHYGKSD